MKTITKTIYEFDELSDKAKEWARDWYRSIETEYHWTDEAVDENIRANEYTFTVDGKREG